MYKKLLAILLSVAFVASLFCGCAKTEVAQTSAQAETKVEVQTEASTEAKSEESKVIIRTGRLTFMNSSMNSVVDTDGVESGFPLQYYDDLNSLILALKSDKIDSIFMLPDVVARYIENNFEGAKALEPIHVRGTMGLCIGTLKENTEVYNLLNDAIDKLLNNGTIAKLQNDYLDKYLRTKEEPMPIDIPKNEGAKTLKIAVTGDMPPIDFVAADGRPAGYNVALLSEISKIANVNIELVQISSAARLTALKTNAIDAIFYAYQGKADDNGKFVDFEKEDLPDDIVVTKPYYTSRIYSVKKMDELVAKGLLTAPKENVQDEKQFYTGVLSYAGFSEEDLNNRMETFGWSIGVKCFDNLSQMMLALRSGQIDYISLFPKSTSEYIKARNNDMVIYKKSATDNDRVKYNMATLEDNKEVYNILNDTLNDIIKDGTIKNIEAKYIDGFINDKDDPKVVDMPHFDNAKTIKVAVTGDLPPFDFVSADGKPAGYNAALLSEIANRAKVNIELVPMDEKAKITALATKNIDAIFWLSSIKYADERNITYDCPKGVILTDSYFEDEQYVICPKGGKADKIFSAN